jgi:hypothetical protein
MFRGRDIVRRRWFDPKVQSQSRFHIGDINTVQDTAGRESVQAAKYLGAQLFDASRVNPYSSPLIWNRKPLLRRDVNDL